MFPLGLLTTGESAEVIKIRVKGDKKVPGCSRGSLKKKGSNSNTRIEDMGFRNGRVVQMLNNGGGGPLLVKLDNARIAIGRGMAMKIMVRRNN